MVFVWTVPKRIYFNLRSLQFQAQFYYFLLEPSHWSYGDFQWGWGSQGMACCKALAVQARDSEFNSQTPLLKSMMWWGMLTTPGLRREAWAGRPLGLAN